MISNDDGISSSGIVATKDAVNDIGETIVLAPENQHSGAGRSLTVSQPLRINEAPLYDGSLGYSVSGTPADCILAGLLKLADEKPDLAITGINLGKI